MAEVLEIEGAERGIQAERGRGYQSIYQTQAHARGAAAESS